MDADSNWSPMKWPKGAFWAQPAALDLIKGTPINCLILPWSGDGGEAARLQPLLAEGKRIGVAFLGLIEGGGNLSASLESARAAGFSAVAAATPGSEGGAAPIPWIPRAGVRFDYRANKDRRRA